MSNKCLIINALYIVELRDLNRMIRMVWFVDFIFCFVGFNGRAWYEFDKVYNIETLCRFFDNMKYFNV